MLLALDTATATASVAVYDLAHDLLLAEYTWRARYRHTQDTLAVAQLVLRQAGVAVAQLTALAVTTGPGSFTGVRIGISAVKGIGLGLPQPPRLAGLPTLCVTAGPWLATAGSPLGPLLPQATVCACIHAGRSRYNWALFEPGDLLYRPTAVEHGTGTAGEFSAALAAFGPQSIWLVGEVDAALYDEVAPLGHVCVVDSVSALRRAGQLARLAALHLAAGTDDNLASLQPLYLQAP